MDGISEKLLLVMALVVFWMVFQEKALAQQPRAASVSVRNQLLQHNPQIGVLPSYR